ncbi:unnamed protein product [Caenorhabditis auriculariae]|uniref:BPTI/Kunitz inhibitor domain-containing protein n=1 Tax=Caenorhabditis auriculariae TaxID=2777116 RepID=A0A8S1HEW5_9PELO|nr:unnamed protein product [Caenorhabditis auriculariae]
MRARCVTLKKRPATSKKAAGDVEVPRTVLSAVPRTVLSAVPQRVHAAPTLRQHAPLQQPFAIAPNTQPAPALFQDSSNFQRSPSNSLDTVAPVAARPRQFSAPKLNRAKGDDGYGMPPIDQYNPQTNTNLAGLSPPVHPTYFTYNSQNQGLRKQFAVNQANFEDKSPVQLPRNNFDPLRNRQAPQSIPTIQPQPQPKFGRQSVPPQTTPTPVQNQRVDFNTQRQSAQFVHKAPLSDRDRELLTRQPVRTFENFEALKISLQNSPQQRQVQRPVQNFEEPRANSFQVRSQPNVAFTRPPQEQFNRNAEVLRIVKNEAQSRQPFLERTPEPSRNSNLGNARSEPTRNSEVEKRPNNLLRNVEEPRNFRPRQQENSFAQQRGRIEFPTETTTASRFVPRRPEPTSTTQRPAEAWWQKTDTPWWLRNPQNPFTAVTKKAWQAPPQAFTTEAPVPKKISSSFELRSSENDFKPKSLPELKIKKIIKQPVLESTTRVWTTSTTTQRPTTTQPLKQRNPVESSPFINFDRKQYIYYNGDFYGPTIPGIRINSTNGQVIDESHGQEDVAAAFRSFQTQLQGFRANVDRFVSAAKTSKTTSPEVPSDKTENLKKASVQTPKVRTPNIHPSKLSELDERAFRHQLKHTSLLLSNNSRRPESRSNSHVISNNPSQHGVSNYFNQNKSILASSTSIAGISDEEEEEELTSEEFEQPSQGRRTFGAVASGVPLHTATHRVENYNSPNPPLREAAAGPILGKKHLEVLPIAGLDAISAAHPPAPELQTTLVPRIPTQSRSLLSVISPPVHHNPNRIITGFVPSSSTTSTTGAPSSTTPATTTSTSIYRTSTTAEDVLEEENETTVVNEVESMPEDDFSREQVIKDVEESEASQKVLFGTAPHASTPNSEFAEEINGSGSELEREEEKEETSNIVPALPPSDPINEYKRINIQPIPNREEEPSETEDSVTAEVTEEKKVSEFSNVSSEEHEDPKASTIEHVFPSSTSTEPSTQPSTTAEATTVSTKAIPTEPSRFAFSSDEDENTELIDVVPEHSHVSSSHTFEVEKPSHIVQTSELDENFKSVEDVSKNAIGRAPEPVDVNSFAMPPRVSPPSTLGTTPSTAAPKTTTSENLVVPAVTSSFEPKFDGRIVCAMPPDAGTCSNYVQRWFFNSQTGQCEQFSFGSCGGNPNNFPDRNICERKCIPHHVILSQVPDRCAIDKDAGFGKGYNVKWYFNMKNLRCEQFVFEGLGGNANQFETLSECERLCTPSSPNNQKTQPTTTTAEPIESEEEDDYSLERLGVESPENGVAPLSSIHRAIVANIDQGIELPPLLIPSEATSTASPSTTTTAATTTRPVPPAVTTTSSAPTTAAPTTAAATTTAAAPQPTTPELLLAPLAPTPDNLPVLPPLLAPTPDSLPVLPPAPEPRPPAAQASKTITEEQIRKESKSYPAESVVGREKFPTANDGQPIVGMSPKETVNYQTGEVNHRASGIRTFPADEGKAINIDADLRKKESSNMPACANGRQEIRYADGRPVMCLPGKNQCPDGSSCYFNGIDFTCCPNEEDPYDKHAFGGYDGEEAKQGYKVFGPLRIRRLMDEVPLRQRRNAEFSLDSVVAPLRFDAEKPHTVSRAQRMRSQPEPRHNANSLCLQPLVRGSCQETHVRYYYDMSSDSCRLFEYSGCDGNANNFGSLQDCQRLCILDIQKIGGSVPTIASTTETPAEPEETLAPGQCPGGRAPLGGSSPVLCGNTTDSIGCPSSYYCRRGPPDVCCPGVDPKLEKPEDIVTDANRGTVTSESNLPRGFNRKVFLSTPKYMCPDAADPLMMENNEPLPCGSGFDGLKMCPKGYYCAIDVEKSSRLCCPMFGDAQRIASEEIFAHRLSLSDSTTTTTTSPFEASEMEEDEDEEEEEGPLAHLQMKPMSPQRDQLQKLAETSPAAPEVEAENVSIDLGGAKETPSEEVTTTTQKAVLDKSICQIKPSEGRVCRDDEKPSRTNLQYFYSPRDRRCKLFFFRGCGGNENRFEKKSDCEALCLV